MWYWFARNVCRIFCKVLFRLRVYGRENIPKEGAFLLVSNHQSFLDPLFCGVTLRRPLHFPARHTLYKNRFFGWLISTVNTIPVRRGEADLAAIKKIIAVLKTNNGVCLFPEGTRTVDGKIQAFKPGIGFLCRRGGAAVVPAVIEGAFECWPRHKKIFSPGRVIVCYGKAISAEQIKAMSDREFAQNLTETLRRMQNDCRTQRGKEPYDY